jgi:hypothetical protein
MEPLQLTKKQYKQVSKEILNLCPKYMGYPASPRFKDRLPKLSIHHYNTEGFCGEFDHEDVVVRVFPNYIRSKMDLIRTIIHEYTHYVQLYNSQRRNAEYAKYDYKVGYENNPFEVEARLNEVKYMRAVYRKVRHLM